MAKKIMFADKYGLTKAVLEGKKTQTRRVVKAPKRYKNQDVNGFYISEDIATQEVLGICMKDYDGSFIEEGYIYPKYKVGEIVAVAQSYRDICDECFWHGAYTVRTSQLYRLAGWSNKMFTSSDEMPHQIRITDVRVERLQDISDEDCLKEGINASNSHEIGYGIPWVYEFGGSKMAYYTPREAYAALIDKVSGKGTWESNPYVFVYDFELVK